MPGDFQNNYQSRFRLYDRSVIVIRTELLANFRVRCCPISHRLPHKIVIRINQSKSSDVCTAILEWL